MIGEVVLCVEFDVEGWSMLGDTLGEQADGEG